MKAGERCLLNNTWSRKSEAGFTLLEVLIAVALLALLSGALYGTYFSVVRGSETVRERTEPLRDARMVLDLLRRELSSACYSKDNDRLHFIVEDRDLFGSPASVLDFTAFTVPRSGSVPSSDAMVVRYRPVRDEEDRPILSRESRDLYLDAKTRPYPFTGRIEGFLVECYDGSTWVKSWDTRLNEALPKAVRVTLQLEGDREGKPAGFTAIVVPRMREP